MKYLKVIHLLHNIRKLLSIIFFFIIPVILSNATSPISPDANLIDEFLRKAVNSYNIPGLAVAVVNDQEIIFISGYGESSTGVNISSDTPFLLGSTSKTFTALGIMRLVEEGKVELDAPVKKYLPEFRLATPEYESLITIRHLLNHTSGLSDKGMPNTSFGKNTLEDELTLLAQCKPVSEPGKTFTYFNVNYRLLGLVIERLTGQTYGEFLNSEIFKPLGMTSTFPGPVGVKGIAEGHGEIFGFPFRREQKYRAGALPSGYIVSSASDIARFLIAELNAGKGDTSIFNPETIKATWQPAGNKKDGYAFGWLVMDTLGKTPFLAHGGSLENYQTFFYLNPELNLGFVFLMNQGGILPMIGGFSTLRNGLIRIIDKEPPQKGPGLWPVIIISGLFLLITGIEVYITFRLKKWRIRVGQKKKWERWTGIIIDFIFSCFLLFAGYKSWSMIYYMLPELFLLIWIMIIFGFIRTFIKIWIIIKNPDVLFDTEI
jgi:CubicO group peptidase (beta-lactamase class C family)